ncbi:TRAPP subunit trs31 [Tulasnella sp. 403]|nr:TRAPP subunit trs31 [Tulasnella sp. 403]
MDTPNNDLALREHIRTLLLEHVRKHICIDYDKHSVEGGSEILASCMKQAPFHGPHEVSLPTDPLLSLLQRADVPTAKSAPLELDEQPLLVPENVISFLKTNLIILRAKPKRRQDAFDIESARSAVPWAFSDVGEAHLPIAPIPVEEELKVDIEDTLSLRMSIPAKERQEVKELINSLPAVVAKGPKKPSILSRLPTRYDAVDNSSIESFLRSESPPIRPQDTRLSPPLIPRTRTPCHRLLPQTSSSKVPSTFSQLQTVIGNELTIGVEMSSDPDIAGESLKVVNGWCTYILFLSPATVMLMFWGSTRLAQTGAIVSSPAKSDTPKPNRSQTSEVNELWEVSSDDDHIRSLSAAKRDTIEMPRNRTPGYPLGNLTKRGVQSFDDLGIVPAPLDNGDIFVTHDREISPSLLGHASTTALDAEVLLDTDNDRIETIYGGIPTNEIINVILKERVDNKGDWLMDGKEDPRREADVLLNYYPYIAVPVLLPPRCEEPRIPFSSMKELLHQLDAKASTFVEEAGKKANWTLGLKKVTGIQSLSIGLMWRPFISGEDSVPTIETATGVDGGLDFLADESQVKSLTQKVSDMSVRRAPDPCRWLLDEECFAPSRPTAPSSEPLLLTRRELRLLSKGSGATKERGIVQLRDSGASSRRQSPVETLDEIYDPVSPRQTPDRPNTNYQTPKAMRLPGGIPGDTPVDKSTGHAGNHSRGLASAPVDLPLGSPPNPTSHPKPLARSGTPSAHKRPADDLGSTPIPNSNKIRLIEFLSLRGRQVPIEEPPAVAPEPVRASPLPVHLPEEPVDQRNIPPELTSAVAYLITSESKPPPPVVTRRYIASLELIQKRGIVRALASPTCGRVTLIERSNLTGVDLIVDASAAVLYFVLAGLPAGASELADRLSRLSPAYSKLLVIFEAYPPSRSRKATFRTTDDWSVDDELSAATDTRDSTPFAFGPPVMKAFKQLRRLLMIHESTGSKQSTCQIEFAFALDEVEAAMYARMFGDARERECAENPVIARAGPWDDRGWLVEDEYEERLSPNLGEDDLAGAFDGMNLFASIYILSRINIDSFVDEASPQQRLEWFSEALGQERMWLSQVRFNKVIEERLGTIGLDPMADMQVDDHGGADPAYDHQTEGMMKEVEMEDCHTVRSLQSGLEPRRSKMQGPVYTHSRLSVFSASSQSSVDLSVTRPSSSSNVSTRPGSSTPGGRPSSLTATANATPPGSQAVSKRTTTIYERNLNKTRLVEVSMSVWAFMFSEVVQYTQKRVSGIGDLERRLNTLGYRVGTRMLELMTWRAEGASKAPKRETRFLPALMWIHTVLWRQLFGKPADAIEKSVENDDEYMVIDNDPPITRHISIPKEMSQLNCSAFSAGIVEAVLDGLCFPARVTAHSVPTDQFPLRTTILIKLDKSVVEREEALKQQ